MARRRPQPRELPERSLEARRRALDGLSLMRDAGISMTEAARRSRTTPRTMKKYLGETLEVEGSGRYQARESDRLVRRMRFMTETGLVALEVRHSSTASKIARYSDAVRKYLAGKGTEFLEPFKGQSFIADGIRYEFITDIQTLERLANAGEVSFEDLYVETIA
mgnify:CR=1 FL=1